MATLRLKFRINLKESEFLFSYNGPLFHRWLPDGEGDAIVLQIKRAKAELKLWFERYGFVERDFIRFDNMRREVDPNIMVKQAILDAGPLTGLLSIRNVTEEEITTLQNNKKGDPNYEALGKRIVKLLYPPLSRFIDILRINYGQYWIRSLEKWDSREHSLGSYCGLRLNLQWSIDEGDTWTPFMPNEPIGELRTIVLLHRRYDEYITQEDWHNLGETVKSGYVPSPAASMLLRTHQYLDQESLKYAFIEGVSALEIAISEFIRGQLGKIEDLMTSANSFWQLPLATQITILGSTLCKSNLDDVKNTVRAIETRNKIIHDGYNPPNSTKDQILGLLKTTSVLLSGTEFRFPTINPGNAIRPLEDWESTKY